MTGVAWIASLTIYWAVPCGNGHFRLTDGSIVYYQGFSPISGKLYSFTPLGRYGLRMPSIQTGFLGREFVLPLWMPFLIGLFFTRWICRREQSHPLGYCEGCDYNLTGNTSGICPECGTRITPAPEGVRK
jgi:hypothetical protein